jgi:hypothetical protein
MTSNVKAFGEQYPILKSCHKDFFSNPSFACSESMIISLPFAFVKTVTQLATETKKAKEYPLPREWRAMVKKDATCSSAGNIKSIQLWRHWRLFTDETKITIDRIFKVEYDKGSSGSRCVSQEFVTEAAAMFYLKKEPWILEPVYHLCSICNYRKVVFGEGAKTSKAQETQHQDTATIGRTNVWFCLTNDSKVCMEGSMRTMLYHMNLVEEANVF